MSLDLPLPYTTSIVIYNNRCHIQHPRTELRWAETVCVCECMYIYNIQTACVCVCVCILHTNRYIRNRVCVCMYIYSIQTCVCVCMYIYNIQTDMYPSTTELGSTERGAMK